MFIDLVRISILLAIALAYALFDIFNKRNVPDGFAYASLAVAVVVTFTYSHTIIMFSILIAAAIGAISYLLYKAGQLGAGDGFEFVTISLIMPLQGGAALLSASQFSLPFILSVFVATGIIAVWVAPAYYLSVHKRSKMAIGGNDILKGATIFLAYMVLILLFIYLFGFRIINAFVLLLIGVPSAFVATYARHINEGMVKYIYPDKLEAEDMIAVNMMSAAEIKFFKGKSRYFGRLVSRKLISEIKGVKRRLPVYRKALPLAAIIFFGIIISLLFGDVLLLLV